MYDVVVVVGIIIEVLGGMALLALMIWGFRWLFAIAHWCFVLPWERSSFSEWIAPKHGPFYFVTRFLPSRRTRT